MSGLVYFILNQSGHVKIGHTRMHATARFSSLATGSAEKLTLIGTLEGSRRLEGALHRKFERLRVRGEWFNYVEPLVSYIDEALRQASLPFGGDTLKRPTKDEYTIRASEWARFLEDREKVRHGRSVADARMFVADFIGFSGGKLENLRRGRIAAISAVDFMALKDAVVRAYREDAEAASSALNITLDIEGQQ